MNLLTAKLEAPRNEGKQAFGGGEGDYCEGGSFTELFRN